LLRTLLSGVCGNRGLSSGAIVNQTLSNNTLCPLFPLLSRRPGEVT